MILQNSIFPRLNSPYFSLQEQLQTLCLSSLIGYRIWLKYQKATLGKLLIMIFAFPSTCFLFYGFSLATIVSSGLTLAYLPQYCIEIRIRYLKGTLGKSLTRMFVILLVIYSNGFNLATILVMNWSKAIVTFQLPLWRRLSG